MSSTRININNTYSCGRSYGIDRTFPAIMNGRMSEHEWELFCDQVDQHIVPLNKLRYLLMGGIFAVFAAFILVMTILMNDFDNSSSSNSPFVFFLIPLGLMIGLVVLSCYVSSVARVALDKVRQVCEAASRDNPKVSLHLRDDRLVVGGYYAGSGSYYRTYHNIYIEASLSEINVVPIVTSGQRSRVDVVPITDLEAGYPDSASSCTNIPLAHATHMRSTNESNINTSVEQRMEKLHGIKHLLSTQEYEEKRDEILAGI
jgi:hypothetical protein